LLRDTEVIDDAEYMVMESVYGNRNHESHEERDQKLDRVLLQTLRYGGTVVIPAFSIERTQVILYSINNLIESGKIPSVPVFLDSPLATKATAIYKSNEDLLNDKARTQIAGGDDIFNFKTLTIIGNSQESAAIHTIKGSKVIIAGSGMSVGGRVISHEKYYLGDPNSTILFVGYQAAGSLGRRIQDGEKNIDIQGQKIHITARIESIDGFSSHKDSEHLVEFVSRSSKTLKKVFVCMGEPASESFLAQRIRDYLGIDAVVPENGDVISLE
ncbi:MAG TPA: MBL fold metallo-hydrolase RNA specificity domain-containing protein, partial [Candidatus Paceibacterota bacterium]|nr:MBL fold metallo-hydrolase RNA specificity domain-containing protein [Candidatus Paceibacterota bacterium]